MRRYHLWGNWVLQPRKKALGHEALWILFCLIIHVPELLGIALVVATVLMQLRRKLLAVVANLFATLDAHALRTNDYDPDSDYLVTMQNPPVGSLLTYTFVGLAAVLLLLVIGLVFSRRIRRTALEVIVVLLYLGGLGGLGILFANPRCALPDGLAAVTAICLMLGSGYLLSRFRLRQLRTENKKGGGFRHPPSPHRN